MLWQILVITAMTFLPFLELRASIPYGILVLNLPWQTVTLIAIIANILLAPLVYLFVNYIMHILLKIKWIKKVYDKVVIRTQKKAHEYVEKWGIFGLALFIGVPLPGSGVYSGILGAYLLGLDFKKAILASIIGVIIAGTLVTIITLTGTGLANAIQ